MIDKQTIIDVVKNSETKEDIIENIKTLFDDNKSIFETLSKINVSEHIEKKNGLNYLSWAWAWDTIMREYPRSYSTVYETQDGMPYWNDGKTAWVKVGFTVVKDADVLGVERIEYFPILNYQNKSIPVDKLTSFDINTAIQRGLTKAIARHGLGFYIYAGQDLPTETSEEKSERLLKELKKLQSRLVELGVDVHDDENFINYVKEKAKVNTLDIAKLSFENIEGAERVCNLFKEVIKAKNG